MQSYIRPGRRFPVIWWVVLMVEEARVLLLTIQVSVTDRADVEH